MSLDKAIEVFKDKCKEVMGPDIVFRGDVVDLGGIQFNYNCIESEIIAGAYFLTLTWQNSMGSQNKIYIHFNLRIPQKLLTDLKMFFRELKSGQHHD
jgi:hypothetical protein